MIKLLKHKEISKEEFFSTENQARIHVLPNEPWIAFEVNKEEIKGYYIVNIEVSFREFKQNFQGLAIRENEVILIIALQGLSYNDVYAAYLEGVNIGVDEDTLVVPKTASVGYIDMLHRRKYISTTATPFWNSSMLPVVITK